MALLAVTLQRSGGGNGVNLVPFAGIAGQFTNVNKELAVANLAGNVLMFVPFPALIRFSFVRSWARALGLAVCSSILIELVQSGIGRSADIDDVLLNSAGALILDPPLMVPDGGWWCFGVCGCGYRGGGRA